MIFSQANNPKCEEVRQHVSILPSMSFTRIKPSLNQVARTRIRPLLGDVWPLLVDHYENASQTPAADWDGLLSVCQEANALLAIGESLQELSLHIGSNGVSKGKSDSSSPANFFEISETQQLYLERGLAAVDEMLELLEAKSAAGGTFEVWQGSEGYTRQKELFLRNTAEFQKVVNIGSSRRTYLALVPLIREAENDVEAAIGAAFFNELKTAWASSNALTTNQSAVVKRINEVAARAAMAQALLSFPVKVVGDSLVKTEAVNEHTQRKIEVDQTDTSVVADRFLRKSEQELKKLKTYLNKNANLFPVFQNSSYYLAPEVVAKLGRPKNSGGIVGF